MFGIGAGEFVLILIVGLIVFGPSKLPEFGRSLGKLIREFRKAQSALSASLNDLDDQKPNTPVAQPTNTVATATTQAQAHQAQADKVNIVKTTAIDTATANIVKPSPDTAVTKVDSPTVASPQNEPAKPSNSNNSNLSTEQLTHLIESNPVKVDTSNFLSKEASAK